MDRDACVPEGEVPCEASEGSQRARGAVRSLQLQYRVSEGGGGWEGEVPEPGGGMSKAVGDRGRGVVDGCIPSMQVGCTF